MSQNGVVSVTVGQSCQERRIRAYCRQMSSKCLCFGELCLKSEWALNVGQIGMDGTCSGRAVPGCADPCLDQHGPTRGVQDCNHHRVVERNPRPKRRVPAQALEKVHAQASFITAVIVDVCGLGICFPSVICHVLKQGCCGNCSLNVLPCTSVTHKPNECRQ